MAMTGLYEKRVPVYVKFDIPGAPYPCPRPRVTSRGTYYSKTYTRWRDKSRWWVPGTSGVFTGPVKIGMVFHFRATHVTRKKGYVRGDLDNYVKSILDLITHSGNLWVDDKQVNELHARKEFCQEAGFLPSTTVYVEAL